MFEGEYLIVFKVLLAGVFGGLVGLERQIKGKPAGLKTNLLISMGACLYTSMSLFSDGGTAGEVSGRVMSQIVTGVGFIGAGTIMRLGDKREGDVYVGGLTTAAAIWMVAAIGIAVGLGLYFAAATISVAVFFLLLMLSEAERNGHKAIRHKKKSN